MDPDDGPARVDPSKVSQKGGPVSRDHPDVLAVCRWLPQPFPFGAFTGRHDHVHSNRLQGYLNLWWSDTVIHPGDYVGPPRGGMAPDPMATYDVAMPLGGYLRVRHGVLMGWDKETSAELILRADGEVFAHERYGPSNPYRLDHYGTMTHDDRLNALAGVRRRRGPAARKPEAVAPDRPPLGNEELANAIGDWVRSARPPDACPYCGPSAEPATKAGNGLNVPGGLLRHVGAVATLTGTSDVDTATDVIWRLSRSMADPAQAGLVRAAEVEARRSADSLSGWPDGPLTEDAVALVAAQALRWHGERIAPRLPFWTLGWIFVARPILDRLLPEVPQLARERLRRSLLDRADQIRVQQVMRTWTAANDASKVLERFRKMADGTDELTPDTAVIDLRDSMRDRLDEGDPNVTGVTPRPHDDYERSVESAIAELTD